MAAPAWNMQVTFADEEPQLLGPSAYGRLSDDPGPYEPRQQPALPGRITAPALGAQPCFCLHP